MRVAEPGQDAVAVTLEAGWNTLLVRVVQGESAHVSYLRLSAEPDDKVRDLSEPDQ
jgi:hypothetical protein